MKKNLLLLLVSFLFMGMIHAQDHFEIVEDEYADISLSIWTSIQIDGVTQTSSELELGMFLDDICRSAVHIRSWYSGSFYAAKPTCNYADPGQVITFKLYVPSTDEELDCDYTLTTTGDEMQLANAQDPVVLNFKHEEATTYVITLEASPANGGTVDGGGTFTEGTSVTVTAEAANGFTFVNWTENGTAVSTSASYTFDVTADRTLVANFEGGSDEPSYPWTPVIPNASVADMYAVVQINGVIITDGTNWELGAFNADNVCRGMGNMENGWLSAEGYDELPYPYYMIMSLYGETGEELSFKLYDLEAGEVFSGVCDVTINFYNDESYGDPFEPLILNFIYTECYTLDITGYGNGEDNYYLISSPVGEISPEDVENMLGDAYDLYYFEQNPQDEVGLEWINYKGANGGYNMEVGKGYLYAHSSDVVLSFCGMPYDGDGIVSLEKKEGVNAEFSGWNLVGNPFPTNATIDRDCYVMKSDGSEIIAGESRNIEPMQGIFVIATEDGETMTFTKQETANDNQGKLVLNINKERGNLVDRAIVRIGESSLLPKFMLHENSSKLYIPQNGNDYAVIAADNETEQLPVNFKATENGTYTMSVDVENAEFELLTLTDHQTGAQVNLLVTPNYQFNASTNDPESRFTISFKSNASVGSEEMFNPICYRQNGQLLVIDFGGEGELQLIDVMGRIVSTTKINGEYSSNINAVAGIYTVRLITNDNTYTQKIVVE